MFNILFKLYTLALLLIILKASILWLTGIAQETTERFIKAPFKCLRKQHVKHSFKQNSTVPDASYKEKPYSITQLPIKYLWQLLRMLTLYIKLKFLTTLERIFVLFIKNCFKHKVKQMCLHKVKQISERPK